ncbi:hypothetical protein FD754_011664 [Muntiacus muntjak]|uniref:Lipid-binding serum glycoprotein N-terminal domain-containing protein n=1 Tax=Muntiacus muntjak TaxID=9888 RepID=A0A5N3VBW9_MUNMU|nr:hypothetical protein FD754_011664 [Muntiacus muntjak]
MLLFWGSLLCWGLLPQAQGKARHLVFTRISKDQLETDISDLLFKHRVLDRVTRIPVRGAAGEGLAILDHMPFVRKGLSKKNSGLDLPLVRGLFSGQSLLPLGELLQLGGYTQSTESQGAYQATQKHPHAHCSQVGHKDSEGPEVTLQVLSDSLLQVTLRSKLYLSLQGILRLRVIKNIRIGARLEQTGNKTHVAFEECHTPPGYLGIQVLEQMNPLLVNKALQLVTDVLDEALPFLLQKIVCPTATILLNSLLEDLLHITLPPASSGPEDFQYYVTTTEFTKEAILMKVQLVTPCGPGETVPRPDYLTPKPLPKLAQGSLANLVFSLETYNDILSCLYTSKEIHAANLIQLLSLSALEPEPKTSDQSRGNVGLTISLPEPPIVHLDGHTASVIQPGSLLLLGSSNTSPISVSWKLLSKAVFSSKNQELKLQFTPNSITVILGPYPAGLAEQKERLEAFLFELLNWRVLPHHNRLHREAGPLPMTQPEGELPEGRDPWFCFLCSYTLSRTPTQETLRKD